MTKEIKVRGSQNILILVDDVAKNAEFIKDLNPSRFYSIEITNMPTGIYADYDAVINLKTKPLYQGYEGNVSTSNNIFSGNRNGSGRNYKHGLQQMNFSYTREKFNFDISAKYDFAQQGLSECYDLSYPLNKISESTLKLNGDNPNKNYRANKFETEFSIDYEISRRHSISTKIALVSSSDYEDYYQTICKQDNGRKDTINQHKSINNVNRLDVMAGVWCTEGEWTIGD